jgi:hypothetical protein
LPRTIPVVVVASAQPGRAGQASAFAKGDVVILGPSQIKGCRGLKTADAVRGAAPESRMLEFE